MARDPRAMSGLLELDALTRRYGAVTAVGGSGSVRWYLAWSDSCRRSERYGGAPVTIPIGGPPLQARDSCSSLGLASEETP